MTSAPAAPQPQPGNSAVGSTTPIRGTEQPANRSADPSPHARWDRRDWLGVAAYGTVILLMHIVGFGTLVLVVAPLNLSVGDQVFGLGLGVTAYILGMRHAFDADHIAVIDNTTRKLMADGGRPKSVGFWFAMGHSGMVFVLTALVALGMQAAAVLMGDGRAHEILSTVGTLVSGAFLYLIGLLNLAALIGIWRVFRGMRAGTFDEARLDEHLAARGLLSRVLDRVGATIRHPWQMFPLGLLFGLGFDTASEVALLVLAGSGAAVGVPLYAVLLLPLLFAAGMSLLDFLDGVFMTVAYDWAFANPIRKVYYNLTVTGLSVAVALVVGTIELVSVLTERLDLHGPVADWVSAIDLGSIGLGVVGLFVIVWMVAVAYWRLGRVEQRWAQRADG